MPGSNRPARPRRWSAEDWLTRTVSRRAMPEDSENFGTRIRPLSITMRTPSMVRLVSAIEVASTILRLSGRRGGDGAVLILGERSP